MTDIYRQEGRGKQQQYWGGGGDQQHDQQLWGGSYYGQQHQQQSWAYQAAKVITAATAGGSLLILSGLTLAGTVIALTVATPLLVIFSPVLVPALITVFTLATGMFASGGFSVAAVTVLTWMYRYMTGDRPAGANSLDQATHKLGSKAREFKDRSEHAMGMGGGGHYGTGGGLHTGGAGVGIHAGGGGGTYSS